MARLTKREDQIYKTTIQAELTNDPCVSNLRIVWQLRMQGLTRHTIAEMVRLVKSRRAQYER
jgi:hypothetical protein